MAEGWSTNVLCRYYVNGACREGSRCHFSHDRQSGQPSNICRYYQKGCCAYGDRCRYDHVKVRQNGQPVSQKASPPGGASGGQSSPSANFLSNPPVPVVRPLTKLKTSDTKSKPSGTMTVLHKHTPPLMNEVGEEIKYTSNPGPSEWVNAPEFIPSAFAPKLYSDVVAPTMPECFIDENEEGNLRLPDELCPYGMVGECPFGIQCQYLHGDMCDLCSCACLHPTDEAQRKKHTQECMQEHERDMELSFAVARSKDKACGICMDIIMEKLPPSERRFGILPNCMHIFCLSCIRKWRGAKQFDNKLVRSCPECRVASDFVAPSKYWVDTKEDKEKLINCYRTAMSTKHCKYFKQGRGECPFGGNCFYLHAFPDGSKVDLPPPRPRKRHNADGDLNVMQSVILWDFLEERDSRLLFHINLEDMLDFFTDSDEDSDWSDYELWD
jgi:E3 ubiquitin-protein ligase makorin